MCIRDRENPYARARIHVSFTVPQDWNHIGIFGVRHESVREGWYWPNRPGATGHTWIDAAEWHVAQRFGWQVDPIESVVFNTRTPAARDRNRLTAARPLDTWQARLTEARAAVAADAMMSETIKAAVTAALRSILINTVGNFASRGRDQTHVTFDPKEIPADAADVNQRGKAFIWTEKARWNSQAERYYHPELAMQVWGLSLIHI